MRISDWSSDVCSSDLRYRLRDWHARGLLRDLDDPDGRQLQHRPRRSPRPQGPERRGEGAGRHGHPAVLRQPPPHLFPGLLMTHALTPETAARFAEIALGHVTREYPHKLDHVMDGPEDVLGPRALHPIFFGDRKSTRLNSSHSCAYRMPDSA